VLADERRDVGLELAVELGGEEGEHGCAGQRVGRSQDRVDPTELLEQAGAGGAGGDVAADGLALGRRGLAVDESGEDLLPGVRPRIPHYSDDERAAGIVA
jgi:hypothetical protein